MLKAECKDGVVTIKFNGGRSEKLADLVCICRAVLQTGGDGLSAYMAFLHVITDKEFLKGVIEGKEDNENDF